MSGPAGSKADTLCLTTLSQNEAEKEAKGPGSSQEGLELGKASVLLTLVFPSPCLQSCGV